MISNFKKKQKHGFFSNALDVVVVVVLSVAIYIAFTPLFAQAETKIVVETLSAAAGAILAAAFTWALLTRQAKAVKNNALLEKQLEILNEQMLDLALRTDELLLKARQHHMNAKTVDQKGEKGPEQQKEIINELSRLHHKLLTAQIPMGAVMPARAAFALKRIADDIDDLISSLSQTKEEDVYKNIKDSIVPRLHLVAQYCGYELDVVDQIELSEQDKEQIASNLNLASQDSQEEGQIAISKEDSSIEENLMCIKVQYDGSDEKILYNRTRAAWRTNVERAKRAHYVLSVNQGKCIEVYKAVKWLPATRSNFPHLLEDIPGRFGFEGEIAEKSTRDKYKNKQVPEQFVSKPGMASPILYNYK